MEYYVAPVDEDTDYLKVASPEELKIIDPACGSGHMLTYAFDLLYAIYEEEGYAPSDIPALILANNLYGTEIDPRAAALAAFALTMKARARQRTFFNKKVEPNICVFEPISFTRAELDTLISRGGDSIEEELFWNQFYQVDLFGALIMPREELIEPLQQHLDANFPKHKDLLLMELLSRAGRVISQAKYLSQRYAIVVTNPPYMGDGNMSGALIEFARQNYPVSKSDLFAMFIERSLALAAARGLVAMITMQSWAFLSSYEKLRNSIFSQGAIRTFAHLGTSAFDSIGGAVVSTAAFVIENGADDAKSGLYIRLTDGRNEREKREILAAAAVDHGHGMRYSVPMREFRIIPGRPIAYWVSKSALETISKFPQLAETAKPRQGLATSDNNRFLKLWFEPSFTKIGFGMPDRVHALSSRKRWFPCQKGGPYRKWYGNNSIVINWENDGEEIIALATKLYRSPTKRLPNMQLYFREGGTWSTISANSFAMRYSPPGFISEHKGAICFADDSRVLLAVIAYANSSAADYFLALTSPTLDFLEGPVSRLPFNPVVDGELLRRCERCISIARLDWDSQEDSWDFWTSPLLNAGASSSRIGDEYLQLRLRQTELTEELRKLEVEISRYFASSYGIEGIVPTDVRPEDITLHMNSAFRFPSIASAQDREDAMRAAAVADFISYAVGCMFGRYILDAPGLILADQGDTLQDYVAKIPNLSFAPDRDNVIPIVDGDWFEDDIVARFRQFLRAAFGEQDFEENLRFVTEALGVKDLRDYFVKSFYKDHVQRYKKRPIYWLFSSPKGSFNALIYMHRYTPSTVSTVLNEYLREFKAKLEASRQHHERLIAGAGTPRQRAAAQKEVDRLRKVLLELDEYEHDVLYPLATQQVQIDLDDGVKANYPKFGAALKKITGLEASDE
jgi:hypothetical protein